MWGWMSDSGPTVLVVEDNPLVLADAAATFQDLGCRVLEAHSADAGLELLSAHPEIALLFADVRLRGMDGLSLAVQARQVRPDIAIALTSGYHEVDVPPSMLFVPKPWRTADLRRLLAAVSLGAPSPGGGANAAAK
jgi:CheY-like chemotaxis protein